MCGVGHSVILVASLLRVILIRHEWCLDMPSLTDVYLPDAFWYKTDVTITGSTHFIPLSRIDIGALYPYVSYDYCTDILRGSDEVMDLVVGNGACRFANVTSFDLSVYPNLETLTIGNYSFYWASLVLKSIRIHSEWWLDMPSLKSLVLRDYAFYKCYRVVFESDCLWCAWLTRLTQTHNTYNCSCVELYIPLSS